ncbi:CPBP family intramembrane glutamic endopeptidase [Leuconostoc suionicum]|uniref:CPBP family intramembrane glutamic endopeptidase n=1 Tax=Leuconostoc suionicum TaxID=1511761 RepID=UPI00233E8E7E|nr:CPBP family intramembrane glutamic endopeptidase [Leuconostoc suionicum]MDC2805123.1 lysostaphin resistance A-like protein [Leuconostoc suionicum]MDC2822635.1 lysostaphin resistance A-like protein [Leuconostoc suionicum]
MTINTFYKKNIFIVGIIFFLLIYHVVPLFERYVVFPVFHLSLFNGALGWIVYSGINFLFVIYLIRLYSSIDSIFEIPKLNGLLITGIGFILYYLVTKYLSQLIIVNNNQAAWNAASTNSSVIAVYIQLFHAVLLGPLLEELVFRGLFIKTSDSKLMFYLKMLLSSVLFSSIHMAYGFEMFPFIYYIIMGIIFSLVYWLGKKLQYSIFLHIIINVIASWEALTIYF